ncbi:rhomboid family intramembrane serine protease [Nigerium massiliense]|uniref:rhomboid family intramembrane serine protease n=1 Tax=Nigerium massiliense TaxID=1522317 RepID=UPI00058C7266|nr:rhomboid family intramembrane serine protease [Nigerium massiliense]
MDPTPSPAPTFYPCYRHPDRLTGVRCQRCGRPVCGECATPASVGVHCPECVALSNQATRRPKPLSRWKGSAVTLSLGAINVAVWAALWLTGAGNSPAFTFLAMHPKAHCMVGNDLYLGIGQAACVASGGTFSPGVAEGAVWQLLTSGFTHVSPVHIFVNMLSLWVLGPQLEVALGRVRFVVLYLVSLLAGSVAVYWLAGTATTTLGASGAIFGLLGGLSLLAWKIGGDVRNVLFWLGLNIVFTFLGGPLISWQGHLGGLAGGLAVTALFLAGRRNPRLAWGGVAGLVVLLVALTALRTLMLA